MRTLVVSAVALLATTVPLSAFAASPSTLISTDSVSLQAMATGDHATNLLSTSTTTKKKKEKASFEEIAPTTRGKKGLEIRVKVAKSGRKCELKVTWKNDASANDDDTSGSDKVCTFNIDVPDSSGVVGDAKASVTVKDSSGKKVATASKTFTVNNK
jgi:hypothetical protein